MSEEVQLIPEYDPTDIVDRERRDEVESKIERGLRRSAEDLMMVGEGLHEMLSECLYKDDFATFAEYTEGVWSISEETAKNWIMAYRVAKRVAREMQASEFSKAVEGLTIAAAHALNAVPDGDAGAVWSRAKVLKYSPSAKEIMEIAGEYRDLRTDVDGMTKEEELTRLQGAERRIDLVNYGDMSAAWAKSMVRKWANHSQKFDTAWEERNPDIVRAYAKIGEGVEELKKLFPVEQKPKKA